MDTFEKVQCRICGAHYKQISTGHAKGHGLTVADYRERFPDAPIVSQALIEVKREGTKQYFKDHPEKGAAHAEKIKLFWADPTNMQKMKQSFSERSPQTEEVIKKISVTMKRRYMEGSKLRECNETDNMKDRINPFSKLGRHVGKSVMEEFVYNLLNPYGFEYNYPFESELSRKRYFYIDFALPKIKLAIELDSETHDKPEVIEVDHRKNKALSQQGWRVFRVSFNSRSRRKFIKVQEEILGILQQHDLEIANVD